MTSIHCATCDKTLAEGEQNFYSGTEEYLCDPHFRETELKDAIAERDQKAKWLEETHLKQLRDLDIKIARLQAPPGAAVFVDCRRIDFAPGKGFAFQDGLKTFAESVTSPFVRAKPDVIVDPVAVDLPAWPKRDPELTLADAKRMAWLLDGNGYFMEHEYLCGHHPASEKQQAEARRAIDEAMAADEKFLRKWNAAGGFTPA